MGKMKNFLLDIEELSARTGYRTDFLLNMWSECVADGNGWDYFKAVTLERDW